MFNEKNCEKMCETPKPDPHYANIDGENFHINPKYDCVLDEEGEFVFCMDSQDKLRTKDATAYYAVDHINHNNDAWEYVLVRVSGKEGIKMLAGKAEKIIL